MTNDRPPDHTIFFYRKGNGGAHVHRSAKTVKRGQRIRFWNITGCRADVTFFEEDVVAFEGSGISIEDKEFVEVTVTRAVKDEKPEYHGYRVRLTCDRPRPGENAVQYAEGGSDPGLIIEP